MSARVAVVLFLAVCVVLAALLMVQAITPVMSGVLFAVALVVFGVASRGFRGA